MKTFHPVRFGSHLPALMAVIACTDGPVLEMGMGCCSSLFLHWACVSHRRELVSYENDRAYFESFCQPFERDHYHTVHYVRDWADAPIECHWSVAFLDHKPAERRKEDVRRLANCADYIVIHDTEPRVDHYFQYDEIYPLFKWRYDYTRHKPWTAVLSNKHDLMDLVI